jgi:hypothetical protein
VHTLSYALFFSGGIIGGLMQTLILIFQARIVNEKLTDFENIYDKIDIHLKKLARIEEYKQRIIRKVIISNI